ncbi:major facilitator superfamily domain-containing protein 6-A-like isoform X2 [Planococcus citri]
MQCAKDAGGSFSFTVAEGEKCLKIQSSASEVNSLEVAVVTKPLDYTNINITLEACGMLCSLNHATNDPYATSDIPSMLNKTTNYTIFVYDHTGSQSTPQTYDYNISGVDFNLPWILSTLTQDVRSFRVQKKSKNFLTSVQAFSAEKYFFPAPGLFNFTCNIQKNLEEVFNCSIKKFDKDDVGNFPYRKFTFTHISPIFSSDDADEIDGFSHGSSIDGASNTRPNKVITNCYQQKWNTSLIANIADRQTIKFNECKPRCIMKTARRYVCKNKYHTKEFDVQFTFWTYLTVRLMIGVIGGTAFAMFEGAVIAILREHNADYGLQHIYASIGGMISSPLSGYLIDYYSKGKGYTDFRPAFYFYGTLKLLSALLMMTINLEFKAPAKNVINDVVRVLKKIEIIALFFTCFILGTAWGYIESFLFWVLQDLGATRSLMGITITIGGIAGIPLLVMSGPIIDHIGHANVLFIGFIFYAIRLVGYSIITAPWQCLIFEAMESITSSLAYTAAVTYAAKMSTTQTDSSVQGILGGLYFGVGKGSGSLSGGYLIKYFGSRNTFRIFSAITLTTGVGYFLFNKFYISKHSSDPEEEEKRNEKRCSNGQIEIHDVSKRKSNGHLKQKDESNGEVNPAFDKTESDSDTKKNTHRRNSYNIEEFMETG